MRPLKVCLFLSILMWGCSEIEKPEVPEHISRLDSLNVYPADSEPVNDITLEYEITYRDTGEVVLSSKLGNLEADDQGNLYIMDYAQTTVHVFDSNGQYLQDIGREGRGPGEFLWLSEIQVGGGQLHILDAR